MQAPEGLVRAGGSVAKMVRSWRARCCWLPAGGLSSSPWGSLQWAAWASSCPGGWFTDRKSSKESKEEATRSFMTYPCKSHSVLCTRVSLLHRWALCGVGLGGGLYISENTRWWTPLGHPGGWRPLRSVSRVWEFKEDFLEEVMPGKPGSETSIPNLRV